MSAARTSVPKPTAARPWRTLASAFILSLLFGAVGMGEPLEDGLRVARNKLAPVSASGDIVVIKVDDRSLAEFGMWPWPRSVQAKLIDRLTDAGSQKILFDFMSRYSTNEKDDALFIDSLRRSGRVVLPAHLRHGQDQGARQRGLPLTALVEHSELGLISFRYNYQNAVWAMPFGMTDRSVYFPSFASIMAKRRAELETMFPVNYRIDVATIPQFSASDVLHGKVRASALRGKMVAVGGTSTSIGDIFWVPGHGRAGGVFLHAIAGETLKRGTPISFGWLAMLIILVPVVALGALCQRTRSQMLVLVGAALVALIVPFYSESRQWFVDVTPALFLILCVGTALGWRRYRVRGTTNLTSGLPNLAALRANRLHRDRILIVTRVINFPQIAAAVGSSNEHVLVDQIVQRLTIGSQNPLIYQGDEGIFAWLAESQTAIGHHIEALHSLFRNPAKIDGNFFDLSVTFGVEIGNGGYLAQRLNNALVAADEAGAEGLKWKYHDPERMKDASWRLSLLSQLDHAIDAGEVWVAYQPQLDLTTGRIRGAEALARWTHPEKGPISPLEFVSAAEQGGRIEKLTLFVLERAVSTAARINRAGSSFDVAVNLSARMLTVKSLPIEVRAILARHGLHPKHLTLELTETAALAGDGSDLAPLLKLRDLGVRLSIDDYGTGLSTLDYLKKVPAGEIKIDQSFVKAMGDSRSDLVMVQSTIALAHSLNRTVVAEGVETKKALDMLKTLKCDVVQGYLIGRPTSDNGLARRMQVERRRRAA